MADISKLLKAVSERIAAHNRLAKEQALAVREANVGELTQGKLNPIRTLRESQIQPEFYYPESYSNQRIDELTNSARMLPTGLPKGAYSNQLRVVDTPFGKVVTPMGEHSNVDSYLVKSKSAHDDAILEDYLRMMSEFE